MQYESAFKNNYYFVEGITITHKKIRTTDNLNLFDKLITSTSHISCTSQVRVVGSHSLLRALTGQIPLVQPETGSVINSSFTYTATLSSLLGEQSYLKA